MQIRTKFKNNVLPHSYGKKADEKDILMGNPVRSFPFEVENLPRGTKYLAFSLVDYDAIPVCSFPWIHWLGANLSVSGSSYSVPEDLSRNTGAEFVQGKNIFSSPLLGEDFSEIATLFVGPTPPDKDHRYTLTVYALSEPVNLQEGFYLNQLLDAVSDKILSSAQINLIGQF